MMTFNLARAGALALLAATLGTTGCASGESGSSSSDSLQGDPAGPSLATRATSFSGRAVAATVKVGKPHGLADYSDNIFVSDTKPLPSAGGNQTASLATVNAGNLLKAAAFNGSSRASADSSVSSASIVNTALFQGPADGILGDVLGDDGHGGTAAVDLRQILSDLGVKDLIENLFGKGGALELGIRADAMEEDARAWCDNAGAHASAGVKIVNLAINGKPIKISMDPNQVINLGVAKITVNAQAKSQDGSAIDAAALQVTILDLVDVKVARASAGVTCPGG